jgi:16S rRNA (adenine1518-N6/adenine1519-N6)-dimethyltransferase
MTGPKKSLGQHWLKDRAILQAIADETKICSNDTVLEIGPGLGTLTGELLSRANKVIAVEFDKQLANKLPGQYPGKNLEVIAADILDYDLSQLPEGYIVVANVPYYITSKIIKKLMTASNKPKVAILLVQKEVAQRLASQPGEMSMLAVSAQVYANVKLGIEVSREYFTPPPEVDSQVVALETRLIPLVASDCEKQFFQVVRAGYSEKRKKLRSSLAGGLHLSKESVDDALAKAGLDLNARAQELSIADWQRLLSYIVI